MSYTTGMNHRIRKRREFTKKEALQKIYIVKAKGKKGGCLYLPNCLVGCRVKLKKIRR